MMKIDRKIFYLSLFLGVLLLTIDILLDRTIFYNATVSIGIINNIPVNELFMRILVMLSFIGFGILVARLLYLRKALEEEHAQDAFFLKQLINAIPAPLFYKDRHYVYRGCNSSFETFLGRPQDEIIGRTVYEIAPKHLAEVYHEKDSDLMNRSGIQVYEAEVKKTDGNISNVVFHKATFVDMKGELDGMIGVILDITELRDAEAEREHTIRELKEALTQVKTLSGLLPICSSCKKIRNDDGYWQRIEGYLREHSGAEFSHSICPVCSEKLIAQYKKDLEEGEQ